MQLKDFDYDLPDELIAQHPLQERDQARLLVIDRQTQTISHDIFANIEQHLPAETTLVVNNSKVIPARLLGHKEGSGGEVEVFLLKALEDGFSFEAMLRPLKKIKGHQKLVFREDVWCELVDRERRIVKFNTPNVLDKLSDVGHIPLPPYIKRDDEESDREFYQTVYAKQEGSVAAPTAGLHFTADLMERLKEKGHSFQELSLHVGYGTFKPVEHEDLTQHPMHVEEYEIAAAVYEEVVQARQQERKIAAVGTTSCRVLESIAVGKKLSDQTNLFIYPPYEFQLTDILITNFHLPRSTLLMLVSAFAGIDLIQQAYQEAIKERYRFYSYGDAMVVV